MKQVRGVYLPDDDTHFEQHLAKGVTFDGHGTYQFEKIKAGIDAVRVRRTAIDIGAHVGLWSMVLQKYFTQVIAFEPVPAHIECFERNLEKVLVSKNLPGKGHVQLLPCALGSETKLIKINAVPDNSGNARVDPKGSVIVDQKRLDDFVLPDVSFIKIDVEGYELDVVRGAERTIRTYRPVMVIEQKPGHAQRYGYKEIEAVELVMKWGATLKWRKAGDYCLAFQ